MKVLKVFKILDTQTGLYSTGGYTPSWTDEGKTYRTKAQVSSALKLYERGSTSWPVKATRKAIEQAQKDARRKVPDFWVVIEFELKPVKRTRATSLV